MMLIISRIPFFTERIIPKLAHLLLDHVRYFSHVAKLSWMISDTQNSTLDIFSYCKDLICKQGHWEGLAKPYILLLFKVLSSESQIDLQTLDAQKIISAIHDSIISLFKVCISNGRMSKGYEDLLWNSS